MSAPEAALAVEAHADETHHEKPKPVDEPPNGGYGWVIVACCFLVNAHTWGVNSSYGIFLAYYLSNNVFPGASSLDYAFIGGLSISMALAISPVGTFVTHRFGTHVTLALGILFETAALLGASFATEIWHLFLSQGLCFGWGMGFLFVGTVGIVPQWFTTKRSFANSIAAAGSGVGGLIYALATNSMIQTISLGWAFRTLAIISFVINTTCAILIRDRNKIVGAVQAAIDLRFLRRPEFLLLFGWGFFSMLGYVVCLFSLPNYATSIGLSAHQGSIVGALLNIGQGLGRPFIGLFSDSFGRINMAGTCTFLAGLFCLVIWINAKSFGVLIFFAIIEGTVAGTFWATVAPVGAEVVGLKTLPSALSLLWLLLVPPTTFSEPIGLKLRASSGNIYLHAQLFAGMMYIGAALCMWTLRAWKVMEVERIAAEQPQLREQALRNDDAVRQQILPGGNVSTDAEGKETDGSTMQPVIPVMSRASTKRQQAVTFFQGFYVWRRV